MSCRPTSVPVSLRPRAGATPGAGEPLRPHDVAIVIPPGATFGFPPLGPPSLKAHLEEGGASVSLHDLNIRSFAELCSPARVTELRDTVGDRAAELRTIHAEHPDRLHLIDHVLGLDGAALAELCDLPDRMRDIERFKHETEYSVVLHHFGVLEQIVELAYHPLQFLPGSLIGGMFARLGSVAEMLEVSTPHDRSVDDALAAHDWNRHDIVGLSAFSFDQLVFALRIAERLRDRTDALIVLGGNVLSESEIPPKLERIILERVDVMVVGDGEGPLGELREVVDGRRQLADVANARWLDAERVHSSERGYKFAFEGRRWPDFDGIPVELYPAPKVVLPFRFSNGCDWGRCTFCAESVDRGELSSRRAYTEVPTNDLGNGIRELHERWGGEVLWNCSSQVTARGCAAIGDVIAETGLPVRWAAMVRSEHAWTPDLIRRAAAGGARAFNFGVESFVPRLNGLMKKGINLGDTADQLREFRRNGVMVTLYTLMNYPTETVEEYAEHLAAVERDLDAFDNVFKSIFMLVAETPALEQIRALGFAVPDDLIDRKHQGEFPYKSIPNGRDRGHYSSGYAYRWDGDRLEEKDDLYHRHVLAVIMREPRYFDRHLEIVTRRKWWQPEYRMIEDLVDGVRQLEGLSLPEILEHDLVARPGVGFERLGGGLAVLTRAGRPTAFYLGGLEARFVELVLTGHTTAEAFAEVVELGRPGAADVLAIYQTIHGRLRQLELFDLVAGDRAGGNAVLGQAREVVA